MKKYLLFFLMATMWLNVCAQQNIGASVVDNNRFVESTSSSSVNNTGDAFSLSKTQALILQKAFSGNMTKELHNQFWSEFQPAERKAVGIIFGDIFNNNIQIIYVFQRAFWKSALLSYESKKVIKTPTLIKLQNFFQNGGYIPFDNNTRLFEVCIDSFRNHFKSAVRDVNKLLISAANHKCVMLHAGLTDKNEKFCLTPKSINTINESLGKKLASVASLMNINWKDNVESVLDVNAKNSDGDTILMDAAYRGKLDVCEILIDIGADVNIKDNRGLSVLMNAVANDQIETVSFLIKNGANINAKADYGGAALGFAVFKNNIKITSILINNGADVNEMDKYGVTPLWLASGNGNITIAKLLIDNGADINAKRTIDGRTALVHAMSNSKLEIAKLLIDHGADVNAKDNKGFSVLMIAAGKGNLDMIGLLLDKGADINASTENGISALKTARYYKQSEVASYLRKHGAKD
jgi:ankyrin repeat protein